METLNREDILRMIGLRDSAGLYSKINSLMIDMYDEGGKLAEYSTQIIQTEKNITLLAQRVTDDETDIADLTVQAQQISASVSSLTTTVNDHTQRIGQLQITANNLTASVSSLTTTVNGHTSKIAALEITDSSISNRVTVIEGDYVKNAQISLMVTKNEQGYISNALVSADKINFVFTDAVTWYWKSKIDDNKRMGLDTGGNLWISGQYRGGTITDNVNVGTTGNKMQIYTDETISPQTGYKKSGIRGVNGSTTLLDLGFGDNNYPMMTLRAPTWAGSPQVTHYPGFSRYSYGLYQAEFGMVSSGDGRIHIYAPLQAWPNRDQVTIGAVFVGNDEILRVRLS